MTRAGDDGYVTLAVLLTGALLAAVVSSLLLVSRPALGISRLEVDEVTAAGLLQGGVATAAFLLGDAGRNLREVNGLTLSRGGATIHIGATDESGRIDLNAATAELLSGLYAAVHGTSMRPENFGGRVVDWRDADNDPSGFGSEIDDYSAAGLLGRPPNRWFRSVDELRFLFGLSRADFNRLAPFVTVYTGRGKVDPLSASTVVLQAIPGVSGDAVQLIVDARRRGWDRERIAQLLPQATPFLSTKSSGVYRVNVQARLENGFADAVEAVIVAQVRKRGRLPGGQMVAPHRGERNAMMGASFDSVPEVMQPVVRAAGRFVDELTAIIEPRLRTGQRRPEYLLVERGEEFDCYHIGRGGTPVLVAKGSLKQLETAKLPRDVRSEPVELRIDGSRVLTKVLTFPAASRGYLDAIVAHQLDRVTPWSSDRVVFDYAVAEDEPAPEGQIAVRLVATSREVFRRAMSRLTAARIKAAVVGTTEDPIERPSPINLMHSDRVGGARRLAPPREPTALWPSSRLQWW